MTISKVHSNLLLSGNWQDAGEMLAALLAAGFRLEYAPPVETDHGLCVVALSTGTDMLHDDVTWLAWARTSDAALTLAAYQAGAQAVLPAGTPPELLVQAVMRIMELSARSGQSGSPQQYRRGELIFLENDRVLEVVDGVLATMMIHKDGAEVLLGLSGPGQILTAHPEDDCYIQFIAHTAATVEIQSWEEALRRPDFPGKLRARLQQMEGWAAMQARPYLDQRLLGILGLLAGQFGRPIEDGILIDMRITHGHLAAALGTTRTTITRVLGDLRTRGKLTIVKHGGKDCFCLHQKGTDTSHHF